MRFLEVWRQLDANELVRLLLPVALLTVAIFLPGRRPARIVAFAVAVSLTIAEGVAPEGGLRIAWVGLWLAIAWLAGAGGGPARRNPGARPGGFESWTVGLPLGLVFLTLLIVAIAREALPPAGVRRATFGVLLVGVGILHLMLRRDALRAVVAFGALGMGLDALDHVAGRALLPGERISPWAMLLGTALSVTLAARLAHVRRHDAGTAWVSDAHDLND